MAVLHQRNGSCKKKGRTDPTIRRRLSPQKSENNASSGSSWLDHIVSDDVETPATSSPGAGLCTAAGAATSGCSHNGSFTGTKCEFVEIHY